ncbi:MAG: hypothetical protein KBT69_00055 [Oceanihabitans sp.]|nr:hypothetical protein [Oceanihabitans sp.]
MIFISKYMVPKGYTGIAIFPFIFLKYRSLKEDIVLLNHEKIHLRQQLELLIVPFYILYFLEFFVRFIGCRNWQQAYRNISFEREAYINEKDLNYLKLRSLWNFVKYY